jgi:hypothetical protein
MSTLQPLNYSDDAMSMMSHTNLNVQGSLPLVMKLLSAV